MQQNNNKAKAALAVILKIRVGNRHLNSLTTYFIVRQIKIYYEFSKTLAVAQMNKVDRVISMTKL